MPGLGPSEAVAVWIVKETLTGLDVSAWMCQCVRARGSLLFFIIIIIIY